MRRIVLALALLGSLASDAQSLELPENLKSQWLMEVEGDTVNVGEFWRIFNKNNFKQEVPSKAALVEYFNLFEKFKLKVKEAEVLGLDTTIKFRNELKGYQKQLAKSYLRDKRVTEALVREGYERSKEEVEVSHILISVPYHALPSDTTEAYKKALMVKKLAQSGASFDSLAVQYSQDPSVKTNKGYLGYFSSFRMVYPFESAAYSTKKGAVSNLVRTRFGYHVLKVHNKRTAVGKIKVAHIMMVLNDKMNSEERAQKEAKIKEVSQLLKEGKSFEMLARKHSEHFGSARSGGALPWFSANQYDPVFENAAFALAENGAISEPVESKYGWHIIKRLDRKDLGSFEDVEVEIRQKVARSDRATKSKEAVLNRIKETYGFKEKKNRKNLNWFYENGDTSIVKGTWRAPEGAKLKKELFRFAGKKYIQKDFADYLSAKLTPRGGGDYRQLISYMYNGWVENICFKHEELMLPLRNKEYSNLLKEYRDGIILFELTDQKVWSKAVQDTAGLRAFYNENQKNWMHGVRIRGELYTCAEAKDADQVHAMLSKGSSMVKILEQINVESQLKVRVENIFADSLKKPMLAAFDYKVGLSPVVKHQDSYLVLKAEEILPAEPKSLIEVKGLVAAKYQDHLMELWIKSLKDSYKVTVNKDAFKALTKHAE